MNKLLSMPIRKQVLILIISMMIAPIALTIYSAMHQRERDIREANFLVESLVSQIKSDQNIMLAGTEQLLSTLALIPSVQQHRTAAVNNILADIIRINPQYSNLLVMDNKGLLWASAVPVQGAVSYSDRRYFRKAIESGGFSSGEYGISRSINKPVMNFGYPIKDASGVVTDVAVVAFTPDKYAQQFKTSRMPANTSIMLTDHKGTIIFNLTAPQTVGEQDREELFRRMSEGPDEGTFKAYSNTGVHRYFAYRKLRLGNEQVPYMYVRTGIPVDVVLKKTTTQSIFNVSVMSSIMLLSLAVALYITRRGIIDKIEALRNATQKVALGNLGDRVSDQVSGGEFGELGEAFDRMSSRLSDEMAEVNRNIRQRLQAEEQRSDDLALVESLLLNSPAGIRVFDAESGKCVLVNQSAADIAGGTRDELLAQNFRCLESWKESGMLALAEKVISDGIPHSMETVLHTSFGKEVPVIYLCSRFIVRDRSNLLVIGRDISEERRLTSERKRIEDQMLHAQKLESLGVLAGGIAHDFNNILTAIIGNADLALMRINKESPAVDNLHRIEQAAFRAADLAKQMLAYSGKGKFLVDSIDLNRLLEEMLQMLEVSISKKAMLRINLHKPLPTVEADATQMHQIVMNLVINASEAIGDESGVISITTGCMECDRSYLKDVWLDENLSDGLYVYLEISDTGCGMDRETLSKLFDPFFTTKFTGRGLGMAAVLGIVRGHKGAIKVYSEPGRGTTFKILLPASDLSDKSHSSDSNTLKDNWKGSGRVLLVDDEETIRGIGAEMLMALGFSSVTANDGLEAVEIFKSNPDISFVILDLTMPHMDGEQCFRELQKLNPDVKVIISSGYNEQEVTQKFIGKGLAGFIQKPYRLSMLREVIRKLL
jgi:PAS domain S-box-containing protein